MSESELPTANGPERSTASRLSVRDRSDRGCPHCGDVALAFDPGTGRARCRSCGEAA